MLQNIRTLLEIANKNNSDPEFSLYKAETEPSFWVHFWGKKEKKKKKEKKNSFE